MRGKGVFIYSSLVCRKGDRLTDSNRYVHGSRIVRTLHNAWPSTHCRIQVLDFHVHPTRPGSEADHIDEAIDNAEPDVPYAHRLVSGPSLLRDRAVFRGGGVESRLAYREVMLKREVGPYSGFMIDDERVIGLSVSAIYQTSG